jgi:hypothetical protein
MTGTKRRTRPIKVLEPDVVPMSEGDYEQAVTAMSILIADWWKREQRAACDEHSNQPDGEPANP